MTFLKSIVVTFSFFTTIPMPMIEWEQKYFRFVPLILPFVGFVIGIIGYLLCYVLTMLDISSLLKAIILVIYFIVITGGLHLDAVMDTCDAHFSRRDIDRKHEIMKDSRVGAFAVVGLFCLLSLKIGILNDLIETTRISYYVVFIPIISRVFQALMLYLAPFALEEGIASLYKGVIKKYDLLVFGFYVGLLIIAGMYTVNVIYLIMISIVYFLVYRRFAIKQFRGITGDIIGAYLEITEVLLFLTVLFI